MAESMTEILKALRKARNEFPPVVKDQENPFFHSKYAALDSIIRAVTPALDENGLTLLAGFDVIEGQSAVWMELHHDSGEFIPKSTLLIPVKRTTKTDSKTGEVTTVEDNPQDVGSGISYMVRYSIKTYLGLPLEDDDGNRASGRSQGTRQEASPAGRLKQPPQGTQKLASGDKDGSVVIRTLEKQLKELGIEPMDLRKEHFGITSLDKATPTELGKYTQMLRDLYTAKSASEG